MSYLCRVSGRHEEYGHRTIITLSLIWAGLATLLSGVITGPFNAGAGILGFPTGGWLSDVAVRRGIGRKPLVVAFTAIQFVLTLAFGFVVAGGAANVWLMAALLFCASTFFNAMQPIAQAMLADIADPAHHGAAFGMNNLIGGAVLFVREATRVESGPAGRFRRAETPMVSSSIG